MFKNLLTLIICLLGVTSWGQLVNDGATITIQNGATLVVEGDVTNLNSGIINNDGTLKVGGDLTSTAGTMSHVTTPGNIEFQGGTDNTINVGANLEVTNFTLNKTGGNVVFASANDVTVKGNLELTTNGIIVLGGTDMLLEGLITGTPSGTRYIKTNGAGFFSKVGQAGSFIFPIGFGGPGTNTDEYNPITVNNTGAASTIGVRALQDALDGGSTGTALDDVITASWEVTGGDANALNVTLNWDAGDEGANWDASISGVARWDVDHWDHSLDQVYGGGNSAIRSGTSAGLFAVGGESVMDEAPMDIQLVLSGPYNGTTSGVLMDNDLAATILPANALSEPYTALTGFSHSGIGGGETAAGFTNVVDWVFIELRDATTNTTVHGTYSALLLNTGQIVGPDLMPLKLKGLRTGTTSPGYNIAIRHRNHLGVLTSAAFGTGTLSRTVATNVNFKGGVAFGANPMKDNSNGIFSLWPGDANSDGKVRYVNNGFPFIPGDGTAILAALSNNAFGQIDGYFSEDINLDGKVRYVNNGFPFIPGDGTAILAALSNNPFGQITQQF